MGDLSALILRGLTETSIHLNQGCLTGTALFDTPGAFGHFIASYSRGKLADSLKSAIFDDIFYSKLKCPKRVGARELTDDDRRYFEALLRILLDAHLRVQVYAERTKIAECCETESFALPLTISVARFIPRSEVNNATMLKKLKEDLQLNPKVEDAFHLSTEKKGSSLA